MSNLSQQYTAVCARLGENAVQLDNVRRQYKQLKSQRKAMLLEVERLEAANRHEAALKAAAKEGQSGIESTI